MNTKISLLSSSSRRSPWFLRLTAGLFLGAAAGGCGLLDIPITLQTQEFKQNFGTATGTVPSVACTMQTDPCTAAASQVQGSVMGATVSGICDTAAQKCTAQLDATVNYPVNLSQDSSFTSSVGGKAVSLVKSVSLKYGVAKNTTTFAIPELDLYIAPQGVTRIDDPNAVYIDKMPSIPKGQTFADGANAITVDTSSKAGQKFVYYIQNPSQSFVLLIHAKPVVHAGDAMPAGEIWVHIIPQFVVGL